MLALTRGSWFCNLHFPNISRLFANICNLAKLHAAPLDAYCLFVGLTHVYVYIRIKNIFIINVYTHTQDCMWCDYSQQIPECESLRNTNAGETVNHLLYPVISFFLLLDREKIVVTPHCPQFHNSHTTVRCDRCEVGDGLSVATDICTPEQTARQGSLRV